MLRGKSWNDGWLTAFWGRDECGAKKSLVFGSPCKPDGSLLYTAFCFVDQLNGKTLVQELEARGYDLTTLQFSVKRKWKPNEKPQ